MKSFVIKILALCLNSGGAIGQASAIALASLAETLLDFVNLSMADDVRQYKRNLQQRVIADTQIRSAEAQRKAAQAVDAVNRASTIQYEEALRRFRLQDEEINLRKKRAEAAQEEAKASAATDQALVIRARAKALTRAFESYAEIVEQAKEMNLVEARETLLEVVRRFTEQGGRLNVDPDNLAALSEGFSKPGVTGPPLKKNIVESESSDGGAP
jgi:hypothetical protein